MPMNVQLELLSSFLLPDFPSGSSINCYDGKLILVGDDANTIVVLRTDYEKDYEKKLFDFKEKRIPKAVKTDLEASTFATINGTDYLLIFGSASTEQRKKVILIPFLGSDLDITRMRSVRDEAFINRLVANGIHEVNIEGATTIGKQLLLSNRGNQKNITNHFIIAEIGFWDNPFEAAVRILPVHIPEVLNDVPGVSEVCYIEALDLLLTTFSSELTSNAYDDGAIGSSYIGVSQMVSQKMSNPFLLVDSMTNLTDVHAAFKNEKIEGICVESINGNTLTLHLISDNDQGQSKLFKLKMILSH
jgi:hypothetical protein